MNEKDDWTLRRRAKAISPFAEVTPSFLFFSFFFFFLLLSNTPSLDFFVSRSIGRIGNIGKKGCRGIGQILKSVL